jgi:hypothetical protein
METWDKSRSEYIDTPIDLQNFYNEIDEICKKYNFSISHEDCHGGFEIERYDQFNIRWLMNASKNY